MRHILEMASIIPIVCSIATPKNAKNLSGGGSFNYFYSETIGSFPERIEMSRGGEDVEAVLGRGEEAELPKYSEGAFRIKAHLDHVTGDGRVVSDELLNQIMPQGAVHKHTMRSLLQALRVVPSADFVCDQVNLRCFFLVFKVSF